MGGIPAGWAVSRGLPAGMEMFFPHFSPQESPWCEHSSAEPSICFHGNVFPRSFCSFCQEGADSRGSVQALFAVSGKWESARFFFGSVGEHQSLPWILGTPLDLQLPVGKLKYKLFPDGGVHFTAEFGILPPSLEQKRFIHHVPDTFFGLTGFLGISWYL